MPAVHTSALHIELPSSLYRLVSVDIDASIMNKVF